MKKKISALALVLVLLLSVTAFARWEGEDLCRPSLNFSGTTAVCTVRVSSDNSSAKINATVKFMRGGSTLATWPLTGTGSATLTQTMGCTSGQTYTLMVTGTCGADPINTYVSATCP